MTISKYKPHPLVSVTMVVEDADQQTQDMLRLDEPLYNVRSVVMYTAKFSKAVLRHSKNQNAVLAFTSLIETLCEAARTNRYTVSPTNGGRPIHWGEPIPKSKTWGYLKFEFKLFGPPDDIDIKRAIALGNAIRRECTRLAALLTP